MPAARAVRVNEAEYGTPRASPYGLAFRRAVRGTVVPPIPGDGGDTLGANGAGLVREMAPLLPAWPTFRDYVGVFFARAATVQPVLRTYGYAGELPMSQQPKLIRTKPWTDPAQGRP